MSNKKKQQDIYFDSEELFSLQHISNVDHPNDVFSYSRYITIGYGDDNPTVSFKETVWDEIGSMARDGYMDGRTDFIWQYARNYDEAQRQHRAKVKLRRCMERSGLPSLHTY